MSVETVGSPGPDDEVWCVVWRKNGSLLLAVGALDDAREYVQEYTGAIVARWDAEGLRWIEAPAPTIMVELPVDYVRTWATDCTIFGSACRAALEREGLA